MACACQQWEDMLDRVKTLLILIQLEMVYRVH